MGEKGGGGWTISKEKHCTKGREERGERFYRSLKQMGEKGVTYGEKHWTKMNGREKEGCT